MTYSQFGCCGNYQISANYVVDNLVMCENRVNTYILIARIFYRKYLNYQKVGKVLFSGFADIFFRLFSTQWCSAPPCGGCQSIASPITALSVGIYRALSETPYFLMNYQHQKRI